MNDACLHVIVTGRVQGVAFRDFVQREARARDLTGWVRNRRDGTVEAVFVGRPERVEEMLAACRRGPPAARVASVEAEPAAPELAGEAGAGFSVRPTL